jgi:subtilisin family serine protease
VYIVLDAYPGLAVCVAAGNDGPDEGTINTPGTAKYAITVGAAIDPRLGAWSLANWSSRGPCDDGRIKPDILALGYEITGADAGTTNKYHADSGTSFATPFVAGLAALWLDKDYSLRVPVSDLHPHPRVKKLLMASATDMPDDSHPGFDSDYGAGRVDALDELSFYTSDISTSSSDAPLVLDYSYSLNPYSHPNEPLWVRDPNYFPGQDWYKFNCYSGLFITATAYSDPDLVLRIKLFDANMNLLALSSVGSYVYVGYFAQYSEKYYIQVTVEVYSGDYYDITIITTPS